MKFCVLALAVLFSASVSAKIAVSDDSSDVASRANAKVESIEDVDKYVLEVKDVVELAIQGEYGRVRRGDKERLEASRDLIARLLDGKTSARELPLQSRIELYNAQEVITSIVRSDDKSRVVCRRVANTGTRIPTTECLTIAERERRARGARENADKMPRPTCIPNQGAGC